MKNKTDTFENLYKIHCTGTIDANIALTAENTTEAYKKAMDNLMEECKLYVKDIKFEITEEFNK